MPLPPVGKVNESLTFSYDERGGSVCRLLRVPFSGLRVSPISSVDERRRSLRRLLTVRAY